MGEHEEEVVDYFGKGPADGMEKTADALAVQSIDDLRDLSALTPLTPQIISRQATINIGTIGHVAHGKSTLVRAISGVKTVRFKRELVQNITIKLGYGNAKLFRCSRAPPPPAAGDADAPPPAPAAPLDAGAKPEPVGEFCMPPGCYTAMGSGARDDPPCPSCGAEMRLVRHVSFVDCPGHDILMATMLNGAAVMDAALLLVAGNEECPQPQTLEHLRAVEIMRLKHVLIVQNKIDLVREAHALKQYAEIKKCVHGTVAHDAPIIPVSAQLRYNIDVVVEYLCDRVPVPLRDFTSPPRLVVIRSFDVNRPGGEVAQLRGGVAGGTIACGVLRVGDEIEVRPGIYKKEGGHARCYPLVSSVKSLKAEDNSLVYAVPGGLIGVGTALDPTLTRADRLVGQVLGRRGQLPGVFVEIEVAVYLLQRLLGVRAEAGGAGALRSATVRVPPLARDEVLMVNIGSMSAGGRVVAVQMDRAKLSLTVPVCCDVGEKCALSRRVDKHWRLIGWGKIQRGVPLPDLPTVPPPPGLAAAGAVAPDVPSVAASMP